MQQTPAFHLLLMEIESRDPLAFKISPLYLFCHLWTKANGRINISLQTIIDPYNRVLNSLKDYKVFPEMIGHTQNWKMCRGE